MRIQPKRGGEIAMSQSFLDHRRIHVLANQECCQAVAQGVKTESRLLPFPQHTQLKCNWLEVIRHQHIGNAGLLALFAEARKYPVCVLGIWTLVTPTLQAS